MRFSKKSNQNSELSTKLSLEFRPRAFYVVFINSNHVLSPILKRGFTHAYVIEELECIYMAFDPTRHGLNVFMPSCDTSHPLVDIMMEQDKSITVLRVLTKPGDKPLIFKPRILSCVSVIEYILGMRLGAVTPYGLYKKLLKAKHPNIISTRELERCTQEEARPEGQPNKPETQQNRKDLAECQLKRGYAKKESAARSCL